MRANWPSCIGKGGKNVPEAEALSLVAGYTLFNDVTARDEQKRAIARSLPWFLSKSYDTFGPLGPCLVTADEIPDPHALEITLSVNGEVKQQASTADMIFSIPRLIAYLSQHLALEPGDVIADGHAARRRPAPPRRHRGSPHPRDRHAVQPRHRRRRVQQYVTKPKKTNSNHGPPPPPLLLHFPELHDWRLS